MKTVAALFVLWNGPYANLAGVECWDVSKDARKYQGPHVVIAHPPCERWGRYWGGGPSTKVRRQKGDDNGCFKSALQSVREFGGVLEHPEASHAWAYHGLIKPPKSGGWIKAGDGLGFTCCVEQGHYGHAARKATWLYAVNVALPELKWGPAPSGIRMDLGYHSKEERARAIKTGVCQRLSKRLSKRQRTITPIPFRDLLLSIARTA